MASPFSSSSPSSPASPSSPIPLKKKSIPHTKSITREQLSKYYEVPIAEVAKKFGICATMLKKICRRNSIPRWPFRKLKSIDKMIASLEATLKENPEDSLTVEREIRSLKAKKAQILETPEILGAMSHGDDSLFLEELDVPSALSKSRAPMPAPLTPRVITQQRLFQQQQQQQVQGQNHLGSIVPIRTAYLPSQFGGNQQQVLSNSSRVSIGSLLSSSCTPTCNVPTAYPCQDPEVLPSYLSHLCPNGSFASPTGFMTSPPEFALKSPPPSSVGTCAALSYESPTVSQQQQQQQSQLPSITSNPGYFRPIILPPLTLANEFASTPIRMNPYQSSGFPSIQAMLNQDFSSTQSEPSSSMMLPSLSYLSGSF